jgi:ribonuclease HI/probable phosphoglycerate mutase
MRGTVYTDGAARGNPGPAAFAYIINLEDGRIVRDKGLIGHATNNVAEYTALIRALERAAELGVSDLSVNSDSELLVKQMKGIYRVANPTLADLHTQSRKLAQRFRNVKFQHVPRGENAEADQLCNQALDAIESDGPARTSRAEVDEAAIDYLQDAALAWARGDPASPAAAEIWRGLYELLKKHKRIR